MVKHNLLLRQLKKLGLSEDYIPSDLISWQNFISHIDTTYQEADQDRYLLERSMEISSRELRELYDNLQQAQETAKLGIWCYDPSTDTFSWSKELTILTNIDSHQVNFSLNDFLKLVAKDQRASYEQLFRDALNNGQEYETEIRVINQKGTSRWLYIIGKPNFVSNNKMSLTGITMDITSRKEAERKLLTLNHQLVETARLAGMAQVATSVLHNIGNILNSANISVQILMATSRNLDVKNISIVNDLLKAHQHDLANFLVTDEKGKYIPQFFLELSKDTIDEYQTIKKELNNVSDRIQDIIEIIFMQQDLSGVSTFKQKFYISNILEEAIKISGIKTTNSSVKLANYCDVDFEINIEKPKLMLILINLLRNAKDSVMKSINKNKIIEVVSTYKNNIITITVKDNGVGIPPEDIYKIFDFGYSTKKGGHGFGLNSSASAAREINGSLQAESKGLGFGATFKLSFEIER